MEIGNFNLDFKTFPFLRNNNNNKNNNNVVNKLGEKCSLFI